LMSTKMAFVCENEACDKRSSGMPKSSIDITRRINFKLIHFCSGQIQVIRL
jgi:hypothetical protein